LYYDAQYLVQLLSSPVAASPGCATFPSGSIPFTSVAYISGPNSAGDKLMVGSVNVPFISSLPLPSQTDQQYCGTVALAPGYSAVAYVPTADERNGDFHAFAGLLIDPLSNQPFPGGFIPVSRLGSVFAWRIVSATGSGVTPSLQVSTATLNFTMSAGSAGSLSQTISVTSSVPGTTLNYSVSTATLAGGTQWLSASPLSGSTPGSHNVSVSPAGLPPGNYFGTVLVTPTNGSAQTVRVTLSVISATASLQVDTTRLNFTATAGSQVSIFQSVTVASAPQGSAVNFVVSSSTLTGGNWLFFTPTAGVTPATIQVAAVASTDNPFGGKTALQPGVYMGTVTIADPLGASPPVSVTVSLTINPSSPAPAGIRIVSGNAQTANASQLFASPLVVTVVNTQGNPVAGVPVSWSFPTLPGTVVTFGPGATAAAFFNMATATDASGRASTGVTAGSTPGPLAVRASISGGSLAVDFSLTVTGGGQLQVSPTSLAFTARQGGSNPPAQTVSLTSNPPASFQVTWFGIQMSISAYSGTTPASLTVSVSATGLSPGTYQGIVMVSASGSTSVLSIPVTLTVTN
jgi:hypothetical protein